MCSPLRHRLESLPPPSSSPSNLAPPSTTVPTSSASPVNPPDFPPARLPPPTPPNPRSPRRSKKDRSKISRSPAPQTTAASCASPPPPESPPHTVSSLHTSQTPSVQSHPRGDTPGNAPAISAAPPCKTSASEFFDPMSVQAKSLPGTPRRETEKDPIWRVATHRKFQSIVLSQIPLPHGPNAIGTGRC